MINNISFIGLFIFFTFPSYSQTNVWIDYDIGLGRRFSDVDDGIALIAAITTPDLNVHGVSYSFGNTNDLDFMHNASLEILRRYKREDIEIFRGASNPNDIYKKTSAIKALAKKLRKQRLSILSMGRMTTIAGLIYHYPELVKNIDQVIVNFGRRLETETKVGRRKVILPDTNIDGDLNAAKILFESKVKLVLIPTELMADQFIQRQHMKLLKNGSKNSRWLHRKIKTWKFLWNLYPGSNGFIPWDLFLVGYLTAPNDFICETQIPIDLKYLKNNTSRLIGANKNKFKYFAVASYRLNSENLGVYCYDVYDSHISNWIKTLSQ